MMASRGVISRQVLVTGPPGVGKTTLVRNVCQRLLNDGVKVKGFYTEEIREHGQRTGFRIVRIHTDKDSATQALLATVNPGSCRGPMVGKYTVMVEDFEKVALECLEDTDSADILVLDELGKMESFSRNFTTLFLQVLKSNRRPPILATIPISKGKPLLLVEEIRKLEGSQIVTLSKQNRDTYVDNVYEIIKTTIPK